MLAAYLFQRVANGGEEIGVCHADGSGKVELDYGLGAADGGGRAFRPGRAPGLFMCSGEGRSAWRAFGLASRRNAAVAICKMHPQVVKKV
jgi:hypothetical protein